MGIKFKKVRIIVPVGYCSHMYINALECVNVNLAYFNRSKMSKSFKGFMVVDTSNRNKEVAAVFTAKEARWIIETKYNAYMTEKERAEKVMLDKIKRIEVIDTSQKSLSLKCCANCTYYTFSSNRAIGRCRIKPRKNRVRPYSTICLGDDHCKEFEYGPHVLDPNRLNGDEPAIKIKDGTVSYTNFRHNERPLNCRDRDGYDRFIVATNIYGLQWAIYARDWRWMQNSICFNTSSKYGGGRWVESDYSPYDFYDIEIIKEVNYKHRILTQISQEKLDEIGQELAYSRYLNRKWPESQIDKEGPIR